MILEYEGVDIAPEVSILRCEYEARECGRVPTLLAEFSDNAGLWDRWAPTAGQRIRALEEGLDNFAGCAVVISHDRWFLDRIATHILAFEGDSKVYFFEGGYSEYEDNKRRRMGDIQPKRFKYKKLK